MLHSPIEIDTFWLSTLWLHFPTHGQIANWNCYTMKLGTLTGKTKNNKNTSKNDFWNDRRQKIFRNESELCLNLSISFSFLIKTPESNWVCHGLFYNPLPHDCRAPVTQSVAFRTWEMEVTSSTPRTFPRLDDNNCDRTHSSLTAVHCVDDVMWESSQWLENNTVVSTGKELQENMDKCTRRRDITKITL